VTLSNRIFFLLFFCSVAATAQNLTKIDSLKDALTSTEGKERFNLLNDLSWEYRSAYPDSTILYANQAYSLGLQLNFTSGLAEPLNFIGVAYNYKGDRLRAFDYYEKALDISTQQQDSVQTAYSNNNLGRLFFEQGILGRSYDYFISSQAIFEDIDDPSGLAYSYQSLARLYKSQGDNDKAENNYLKANEIRLTLGNTPDITSAFIQTGRFYQEEGRHDEALHFLRLAESTAREINDEINLAEIKTYIARSFLHQGLLTEAEEMCTEGLKSILQKENVRMLPPAYQTLGEISFAKGDLAAAQRNFKLAMAISTRSRDLASTMNAHYFLWKISQRQGNKQAELQYQNQYLILRDSIKDLDLAREVERFQFEIEIERKEKENELLKISQARTEAIVKQQKLQNVILIIVIAFVSLLGIIQWRNSKRRREVNERLEQQNQFIQNQRQEIIDQNETLSRRNVQLSDINHEKDTLMGIVAHDLKSPLNRIKSIADLMEFEGNLSPDQHNYVRMTKDATQAGLDLIKDLLDVHMLEENVIPNYTSFDMSKLLLDKMSAYGPAAEAKQIHLNIRHVDSEEVVLDADYVGRILDNLITNAIKCSSKDTTVDISALKENGHLKISVKDQGQGFSDRDKVQLFQKFKKLSARPTAGESSNGLGLAIVKTLVDRLGGSIDLVSEKGKGSQFVVKLPCSTQ
jgi:signal transduction histidine kinase